MEMDYYRGIILTIDAIFFGLTRRSIIAPNMEPLGLKIAGLVYPTLSKATGNQYENMFRLIPNKLGSIDGGELLRSLAICLFGFLVGSVVSVARRDESINAGWTLATVGVISSLTEALLND